jgi:hypothetical protein
MTCGHTKSDHDTTKTFHEDWTENTNICWECSKDGKYGLVEHDFIDNLTFIEREARRRNLV